jgi:putative peptidoglycan lipid II flippase
VFLIHNTKSRTTVGSAPPRATPTAMKTGSNTITVDNASPTSYLVVWITTLGTVDARSETAISDITIKSTS